jgi:hypothetical protein
MSPPFVYRIMKFTFDGKEYENAQDAENDIHNKIAEWGDCVLPRGHLFANKLELLFYDLCEKHTYLVMGFFIENSHTYACLSNGTSLRFDWVQGLKALDDSEISPMETTVVPSNPVKDLLTIMQPYYDELHPDLPQANMVAQLSFENLTSEFFHDDTTIMRKSVAYSEIIELWREFLNVTPLWHGVIRH